MDILIDLKTKTMLKKFSMKEMSAFLRILRRFN